MIKKQILDFFQYQLKQFEQNFEPAFTTVDENTIHDMRVSIKRLRLLYRFLDFASEKQFYAKKRVKLLLDVFKSAGPLRDAQIQLSLLEKLKEDLKSDFTELDSFLSIKEESGIKKFKEKGGTFDLEKINYLFNFTEAVLKIIIDFPGLQKTFDNYKENRQQKIENLLKNRKQKIDFHQVRKKIKDLTYMAEIQGIQSDESAKELYHFKQMGRELGNWHNIVVFLQELEAIKRKNTTYLDVIMEIETKLKHKKQLIIDEFYQEYLKK